MIHLDVFTYFFKELFDLLLLFVLIGILTKIKSTRFYGLLIVLLFPITLLSVTDTFLTGIALTIIFILLRVPVWKRIPDCRVNDLFGFLLSLSLYAIVPLFSSIIATSGLNLKFYVSLKNGPLVALMMVVLDWVISLILVIPLKKKVLNHSFSKDEKKIFTMQFAVFLTFVYLFGDILRKMEVLGVFRLIMVGFLVAQFSFTIFLTYLSIKKNREKVELENLKEQMEMMNAYTTDVEKNYQELRKFRHDYKNMLLGLKASENESGLNQEYLDQMMAYSYQMIDTSVMRFSGISHLKIASIKSLIITKLLQAEQAGLTVNFECLVPIDMINMDEVKLIRILGILVDNATEAASDSQNKFLTILFIDSSDTIEISIENSYKGKLPSIAKMSKEGFSSKGKDRGLGLANVQEILSTARQADVTYFADNGLFVSTITIKKA
ncbi:GHKL domain-containing protein [Enterococcus sp.]|uniref:sensor histidine kinase n=1 Tax=Enterococcus sp. TaxID=35783 RepID=UPI002909CAAA|nr:GHKL domain-containing protein [Enterococcus sp.]MDU5336795.1 GHKL domain-containing protein [Enterococcus sp.]